MKEFIALRTVSFGLLLMIAGAAAALVKVAADVVSLVSREIAMASIDRLGRLEKLSF